MIKHVRMLRLGDHASDGSRVRRFTRRIKRAKFQRCDLGIALGEQQMAVVLLDRLGRSISSSLADRIATANDELEQFAQLSEVLGHYEQRAPLSSVSVAIAGTRMLREPFDVPAGVSALQIERFAAGRAEQLKHQLGVDVCHDFYLLAAQHSHSDDRRRGVLIVCRKSTVEAVSVAVARTSRALLRVVPECIALSSAALRLGNDWLCWRQGRCYELVARPSAESFFCRASGDGVAQEQTALEMLLKRAGGASAAVVIRTAGEPLRCSDAHLSTAFGCRFVPLGLPTALAMPPCCEALDDAFVVPLALAMDAAAVPSLEAVAAR